MNYQIFRVIKRKLRRKQNFNILQGDNCRFTSSVKIYNHAKDPRAIRLGQGILLDGILEVYERGMLNIGDFTFIGNSRIMCADTISIGTGCWIADHVFIMDSDLHPISARRRLEDAIAFASGTFPDVYEGIPNAPVILEDKVWIGANSVILKGVTVGEGVIVGAGSVVTHDIPPWTIVAGNPAQVIREIHEHER